MSPQVATTAWLARILGAAATIVVALARPATAHPDLRSPADSGGDRAPVAVGRVFEAGPGPIGLYLLSAGGYGYTGSVLRMNDAHHRLAGLVALEGRPLSWLGLALRFDGRYDRHTSAGQPSDGGLVGDPRIFVRVDRALGAGLKIGARAGLWLPGSDAPSLPMDALSPELAGALALSPGSGSLTLAANVGYHLDRSARTAPDAAQLSPGDRLALGVSAFDSVLLGASATFGRHALQGFVEASWRILVGTGAPSALSSPLIAGAGIRTAWGPRLRLEAEVELGLGKRPEVGAGAALVPVPPRAAGWLGLAYAFGAAGRSPALASSSLVVPDVPPPSAASSAESPPPPSPPAPSPVTLRARVSADDGGPLVEPRVQISGPGGEGAPRPPRTALVDSDGWFEIEATRGEVLNIEIEAVGCEPVTRTLTVEGSQATDLTIGLHRRLPIGQLRGLVRSLRGTVIDAAVEIRDVGGSAEGHRTLQAANGRFQMDVAPGTYEVSISASGYETQRRRVTVEQNGVTLLNIDLRLAR
jgi:hypothetical protein